LELQFKNWSQISRRFAEPRLEDLNHYRSCIVVPVTALGPGVIGFFQIDHPSANAFDDGYDVKVMQQLGDYISIVLSQRYMAYVATRIMESLPYPESV